MSTAFDKSALTVIRKLKPQGPKFGAILDFVHVLLMGVAVVVLFKLLTVSESSEALEPS